ncbi:hypothetical protein K2173_013394 [Erythroxylum novogranatense]|uniref:CCHC-type domain-containing protein n=1 Tax=Erythroxylum novogranatense TaxID=1862640 RepID=A0AAV8S9R1_9ROSI|nr:hypothetical protein K2173_013394 [Erythroxylum novogranatense]
MDICFGEGIDYYDLAPVLMLNPTDSEPPGHATKKICLREREEDPPPAAPSEQPHPSYSAVVSGNLDLGSVACYHPSILTALGNLVGRTVKIDSHTQYAHRGKFARVTVDLDLNSPLKAVVELDGESIKVAYEGLPQICFHCGRVGHGAPTCPSGPIEDTEVPPLPLAQSRHTTPLTEKELLPQRPGTRMLDRGCKFIDVSVALRPTPRRKGQSSTTRLSLDPIEPPTVISLQPTVAPSFVPNGSLSQSNGTTTSLAKPKSTDPRGKRVALTQRPENSTLHPQQTTSQVNHQATPILQPTDAFSPLQAYVGQAHTPNVLPTCSPQPTEDAAPLQAPVSQAQPPSNIPARSPHLVNPTPSHTTLSIPSHFDIHIQDKSVLILLQADSRSQDMEVETADNSNPNILADMTPSYLLLSLRPSDLDLAPTPRIDSSIGFDTPIAESSEHLTTRLDRDQPDPALLPTID